MIASSSGARLKKFLGKDIANLACFAGDVPVGVCSDLQGRFALAKVIACFIAMVCVKILANMLRWR